MTADEGAGVVNHTLEGCLTDAEIAASGITLDTWEISAVSGTTGADNLPISYTYRIYRAEPDFNCNVEGDCPADPDASITPAPADVPDPWYWIDSWEGVGCTIANASNPLKYHVPGIKAQYAGFDICNAPLPVMPGFKAVYYSGPFPVEPT